ncbi:hydroxyisourate hydrolase [soil metagenome]
MSQLTSHVLDTTTGKPAKEITAVLYYGENDEWKEIRRGITNDDGRIKDLFGTTENLTYGIYKMRFETKDYFDKKQIKTFYPFVEIIFEIDSKEHYHIPLLLNPFGYTTYRGS